MKPWFGVGHDFNGDEPIEEILDQSNLNFTVTKRPLVAQLDPVNDHISRFETFLKKDDGHFEFLDIEQQFATVGTFENDPNQSKQHFPIGVVGVQYKVTQNKELADYVVQLTEQMNGRIVAAGLLNLRPFFVVKSESLTIAENVFSGFDGERDDVIENYYIIMSSHDGTLSTHILHTPVRCACQNTLPALTSNSIAVIKHTSSSEARLKEIIDISNQIEEVNKSFGETIKRFKVETFTESEYKLLVYKLMLSKKEFKDVFIDKIPINKAVSTRKINIMNTMIDYYNTGPGQNYPETKLKALNGITGYFSNSVKHDKANKRMNALVVGEHSTLIQKTIQYLINSKPKS